MEAAVLEGISYYWDGKYFARHPKGSSPVRAHVELWEERFGCVPEGYCIHHFDHDRRNNSLSNLVVMLLTEHGKMHGKERAEHMRSIQPLGLEKAAEWHKSEDGRAQGRKQFEALMRKIGELKCPECTTLFTPTNFRQKYCCKRCSNRVKSRMWRARQKGMASKA